MVFGVNRTGVLANGTLPVHYEEGPPDGRLIPDNARAPDIPVQGPIALQHHSHRREGEWKASFLQFQRIFIKELNEPASHRNP
jgi:hypothetical protein